MKRGGRSRAARRRAKITRRRGHEQTGVAAKRLGWAIAAAIAIHVDLFLFIPRHEATPPDEHVVTLPITLAVRTPKPTPPPTPPPVVPTPRITPPPHYTLTPHIVVRAPAPKAVSKPHHRVGGAAAPKHVLQTPVPVPLQPAVPNSVAVGTHEGVSNGGTGTGAGPGAGDGGLGGTGTGTGGAGNGNGGETNGAPCGDIFILPGDLTYRHDGTAVQEVLAKIVLHDGTVQVGRFPYPFIYRDEAQNPFVHSDRLSSNGGVPVQEPPAGADVGTMPPAVQVVLKHTNPQTGTTTLPECTHDEAPAA